MKFFRYSALIAASLGSFAGLVACASAQTASVAPTSLQAQVSQCPVVSSFMKQGIPNDKAAVTKLQQFLKDSEKLDVDVNGTFDQKTEDAAKAFQKKYADSILAPWGATKASGIVYITTAKKINQLACSEAMTLDQKELAIMADYQSGTAASASNVAAAAPAADPVVTYPSDPANSQTMPVSGPSLTASAVLAPGSSIMSKLEYYLANLF